MRMSETIDLIVYTNENIYKKIKFLKISVKIKNNVN